MIRVCLGLRLQLGLALALMLPACGGSSSETPPPLQPDPAGFHYAGVPASKHEDGADAGDSEGDSDDDKPKRPAAGSPGVPSPNQ